MTRVATIVGARPQFIKASVVSRALRALPGVCEFLIHTGQHYNPDMSDIFFRELSIPAPDRYLGVGSGTHGAQTGRILEAVENVLIDSKPDWVLVYGDTNTTIAGALAAVKLRLRTAHVESGLRSFNRAMPEEINRVLIDHASDLLFAPTKTAVGNLRREGLPEERIRLVGDVMYDAALFYAKKAERESHLLNTLALQPRSYVLATVHRAENTDDPSRLLAVLDGLTRIVADLPVVVPLHPRTRARLQATSALERCLEHIRVINPIGYLDMVRLESNARVIATDSGGVQKEAFFYGVPCVTLREETEWVETVEAGANRLAGADPNRIERALREALSASPFRIDPADFYGNGDAGSKIAYSLL